MKTLLLPLIALLAAGAASAQPAAFPRRPVEAGSTNVATDALELTITNDLSASDELTDTNEVADTNGPAPKNPAAGAVPAAPARDGRQSRQRFEQKKAAQAQRAASSSAGSDSASGPARVEFSAFSLIVDRNIFDPNRHPRTKTPDAPPPAPTETFALVGTMSYDKGTFAFFKGSSARYEKVLKLRDSIAGFKLTAIAPNTVKLASPTNELDLPIGSQMRRVEDGPWKVSNDSSAIIASSVSTAAAAGAASSTDSSAGGSESDILKKLKQRREQE